MNAPYFRTLTCVMAVLFTFSLPTRFEILASSAPKTWPGPENIEMGHVSVRDRPKRLFLVTAVTETGAEIQLLVSAVTVTRPKLTNDLLP